MEVWEREWQSISPLSASECLIVVTPTESQAEFPHDKVFCPFQHVLSHPSLSLKDPCWFSSPWLSNCPFITFSPEGPWRRLWFAGRLWLTQWLSVTKVSKLLMKVYWLWPQKMCKPVLLCLTTTLCLLHFMALLLWASFGPQNIHWQEHRWPLPDFSLLSVSMWLDYSWV